MSPFFDYELPEHLIAQHPTAQRDESRLLIVRCGAAMLKHRTFRDLPDLLTPGDLLVLNDTKVLPARMVGRREATGGKWEGLFLGQTADGLWEMLAQTRGYPEVGTTFIADTGLRLTLRGRTDDRHWLMQPEAVGTPLELLSRYGHIPLPPYIRKGRAADDDEERYQTVYAARAGSVAAPTAGLHFTPELFDRLGAKGIETAKVTLHVGLGTFAPVKVDDPAKHLIHREWCEVTQTTVDAICAAKARGNRVVAVGTTTTRTLESAARSDGLKPFSGETGLYIREPFEFQVLDALVTNFHLPRTTLLLLVGAFAGSELLRKAYSEAIASGYRFYSYGDAMLVLR
ncbi:MAG TPA: tRNA preQ1(34) S-adenosylmethionine ribosyltransferase-isomerase QueA [Gemmata sp.]|jgi:S-adenosylmethionine:tRNA ribosyltransferase-isomerase|nr:tRNA preQ1(34) S-adenosylmethionine ribosyltransferase-isomerase QueA [Gemmata sp.]